MLLDQSQIQEEEIEQNIFIILPPDGCPLLGAPLHGVQGIFQTIRRIAVESPSWGLGHEISKYILIFSHNCVSRHEHSPQLQRPWLRICN